MKIAPILRLIAVFIMSGTVVYAGDVFILTLLLIFVFLSVLLSGKRNKVIDRSKPLLVVALLIILFQLVLNTALPINLRLLNGLIAGIKIILLSLTVFLYTLNVSPADTISALSFLPPKIRLLLTITFSLIPVIDTDSRNILAVQNTRGYKRNNLNIFYSIIPVLIPLLHRILKRAEQIAQIMEVKGYDRI